MLLMIYQNDVFREIILPKIDNTDYRILIDKRQFSVGYSFCISLEIINKQWIICDNKAYRLIHHREPQDRIPINGGEIITIKTAAGEFLKCIVVDCDCGLIAFEKFDISRLGRITVGNSGDNLIRYEFLNLVSKNHSAFFTSGGSYYIEDYSSNGTFLNNRRVYGVTQLNFGDIIDIFGLKIIFLNSLIAVGALSGSYCVSPEMQRYIPSQPETDSAFSKNKHIDAYFNRSPRIFPPVAKETLVIEPPTTPQLSKKRSMISVIGPSLTMAIPMLLGCLLMIYSSTLSGGSSGAFMYTGIITSVGSALLGAMWAFINIRETKKEEIADENQRFNLYGNYLIETADYIKEKYIQNTNSLNIMYPSAEVCCTYNESSPQLWNRNLSQDDFLFCRLGSGNMDFQVDIQVPKEKFSVTFDALKDKPAMLYENFKVLKNVPVGFNIGESSLYGIVGGKHKQGAYQVVNNIIAQVAANISYTDVKIVFCYNEESLGNKNQWDYIKWLPHIWSENKSIRYFATNKQEISDVFFELSNILRSRKESSDSHSGSKQFRPYYLLFASDTSLFDGEIIGRYVFDNENNYGLTTFIMADSYHNLPNSCENIIQNDRDFRGVYRMYAKNEKESAIDFDSVSESSLTSLARNISNIYVKEIEDDTSIASSLDFFEMYNASALEDFNITEQWRKNRTYNTMRVLVGKKAGGADCYLDIHEKFHGPHGLIAGTTGSGKSELIQTLVLSLAINYSPDDISFFVIDFKGGGMANLFSDLPHMAGQISNLSGNQIGRAMISIKSENLRRQKLFGQYGVNNINLYTRLFKSGEAQEPIPHLVIIIDEFAELKREEPEFMRELISVAQVGRSLGVHLILATQKPAGTVDDNIWSNAKFRMCLRVQDRQDSNDMLHKPDAAYITQAGRCYLQVGNDEIYELFQSGWSGAVYDEKSGEDKNEAVTMITPTGKTAVVGSHTKMKKKELERNRWYKFLLKEYMSMRKAYPEEEGSPLIAEKILESARQKGYNIGKSDAEIRSVQQFAELVPGEFKSCDEAVRIITEKAVEKGVKLPELKEKTQLEAIVEYIGKIARENGYERKTRLWMPLLKEKISLNEICDLSRYFGPDGWKPREEWSLEAVAGLYDDPQNQAQMPFSVNFSANGHLAVCGSVVSGKSTFLQTLIFSLAVKYPPDYVNFYILDFSSGMLSVFEKMPHTGGVLRESDADKTDKLFNMLQTIVNERKALFKGGNYSQFVKVHGVCIPSLFIVIDNFAGFKEKTDNKYEDILIHLSREGVSYGIYLVISSAGFGISEIQNRIGDNIRTVVSLEMSDKFKYLDVLRTAHTDVTPAPGVKGRGVGFVDGRLLEFQTALSADAEDDYKRNTAIEGLCENMRKLWTGAVARPVPFIPENPVFDDFAGLEGYRTACNTQELMPIGYNTEDASVYSLNLSRTYCCCISGKRRTGKTNLLKILICAAAEKNIKSVIIEKEGNELKQLASQCGFEYISSDAGVFNFFNGITDDFIERNKFKRSCGDRGLTDNEIYGEMQRFRPVAIFIDNLTSFIKSVYHPENGVGNMSGFFENILEKGQLHNIYFFGCVNTDDANEAAGYKAFRCFTSSRAGVHLGGNVASQRIFNFQNIHYNDMSRTMKKGVGLTPSAEDETAAQKIIIPLYGGKQV